MNDDVYSKIKRSYKKKMSAYITKVKRLLFENYFDMIDAQSRRCKIYGAIGGLTCTLKD